MSSNIIPLGSNNYQSNNFINSSYKPTKTDYYNSSINKTNNFTQEKPNFGKDSNFNAISYSYQAEIPNSNVIIDSNLKKIRVDSGKQQYIANTNLTEKNQYNINDDKIYQPNIKSNYSINQTINTFQKNENLISNENKNLTIPNTNIYSNQYKSINGSDRINTIGNSSIKQNQSSNNIVDNKNVFENLAENPNKYIYRKKIDQYGNISINLNNKEYNQNSQNENISINSNTINPKDFSNNILKYSYGGEQNISSDKNKVLNEGIYENQNNDNNLNSAYFSKGNQNEKNKYENIRFNGNINERNKIDIENNDEKIENNNNNLNQYQNQATNVYQENEEYEENINRNEYNNEFKGKQNSSIEKEENIFYNNQKNTNLNEPKDKLLFSKEKANSNINENNKLYNDNDNQNQNNIDLILDKENNNAYNINDGLKIIEPKAIMPDTNEKVNTNDNEYEKELKAKLCYTDDNQFLNENKESQNQKIFNENINFFDKEENYNQLSNENQFSKELQKENNVNYNENINLNINMPQKREKEKKIQNHNQNVQIMNKHEEKEIVVLPGQTIEPKTINETFLNPVVEAIENEDGTTSSVIKQTKITTIVENIPIGIKKIKEIEGEPELPMVKQYITYEYKTVTTFKMDKITKNIKSQNKEDISIRNNYQEQNNEKIVFKEQNKIINGSTGINMENNEKNKNDEINLNNKQENFKAQINENNLEENNNNYLIENNIENNADNMKLEKVEDNGDIQGENVDLNNIDKKSNMKQEVSNEDNNIKLEQTGDNLDNKESNINRGKKEEQQSGTIVNKELHKGNKKNNEMEMNNKEVKLLSEKSQKNKDKNINTIKKYDINNTINNLQTIKLEDNIDIKGNNINLGKNKEEKTKKKKFTFSKKSKNKNEKEGNYKEEILLSEKGSKFEEKNLNIKKSDIKINKNSNISKEKYVDNLNSKGKGNNKTYGKSKEKKDDKKFSKKLSLSKNKNNLRKFNTETNVISGKIEKYEEKKKKIEKNDIKNKKVSNIKTEKLGENKGTKIDNKKLGINEKEQNKKIDNRKSSLSKNKNNKSQSDYKEGNLIFGKNEKYLKKNIKNESKSKNEYSRRIQKNKRDIQKLRLFLDDKNENKRNNTISYGKDLKNNKKTISKLGENNEEKIIKDIIRKGNKSTRDEKQKIFRYLFNLYRQCKNSGTEEELEKLSVILYSIEENERKLILSKLYKNFPKNEGLYKKLTELISKQHDIREKTKKVKKISTNLKIKKQNEKLKTGKKVENLGGKEKLGFTSERSQEKVGMSSTILNNKSKSIEIKNITPLKFDIKNFGISKYNNRKDNPFGGISSFNNIYKGRKTNIKTKMISFSGEIND